MEHRCLADLVSGRFMLCRFRFESSQGSERALLLLLVVLNVCMYLCVKRIVVEMRGNCRPAGEVIARGEGFPCLGLDTAKIHVYC